MTIAEDPITFDMLLLEVSITRQNASSGAVKKNVNKLPLLLDEDEDDVEVTPLSSTGCMLGESNNIACSPLSCPLIDCERRNKILPLNDSNSVFEKRVIYCEAGISNIGAFTISCKKI